MLLYCHLQHHSDTIIKTQEVFFINICTSHFIVRFEKVVWGFTVRVSWRPNRNCNILTPTPMAVNVVSFSFSRCSTGGLGPTLLGDGFLYCILSATSLVSKLHRGSRGSLQPGVVLPTTARLSPSQTLLQLALDFCLD